MPTIQDIIDYMESTPEESWQMGVVRRGDCNCFFGHLFNMGGGDSGGSDLWNWFESHYATTFMLYPINDGDDGRYPQATPKQRVIAYLRDLEAGKEQTVSQMDEEYRKEIEEEMVTL